MFEVVAGGSVVASAEMDQTTGGDEWHTVAEVALSVADTPVVRLRNGAGGPCIADALHVFSQSRLNDGSPAPQVTLEPMDGIILRHEVPAGLTLVGQ